MIAKADHPRVVFDCNVLIQSLLNERGPAAECLRLLDRHRIDVLLSRPILRELRTVLDYPDIRNRNPQLGDVYINAFLKD